MSITWKQMGRWQWIGLNGRGDRPVKIVHQVYPVNKFVIYRQRTIKKKPRFERVDETNTLSEAKQLVEKFFS